MPGPLPGVPFGVVPHAHAEAGEIDVVGAEVGPEVALGVLDAGEPGLGIEEVAEIVGPLHEEFGIFLLAELFCHLGHAIVVVAGFHEPGLGLYVGDVEGEIQRFEIDPSRCTENLAFFPRQ